MDFTNKENLPDWVAKGLSNSTYNRDGIRFDISATRLIDSPLVAKLWKEHGRDVVEDVMDRTWSAYGTSVHAVFEEANKANSQVIMEKRYLHEYEGKVVSGQIDCYEISSKTISDIKTCAAFKVIKGLYTSWENQTNVCAALMRHNGYPVEKLQVVALVKDWSAYKARNERNYPEHPITVIDLPLWTPETADDYIKERLALHFSDGTKECSPDERWVRAGRFAVMKKGRKSALRLVDSHEQGEAYIKYSKLEGDEDISIVERKGQYVRCDDYCAFSKMGVCPQIKASQDATTQEISKDG